MICSKHYLLSHEGLSFSRPGMAGRAGAAGRDTLRRERRLPAHGRGPHAAPARDLGELELPGQHAPVRRPGSRVRQLLAEQPAGAA